MKAIGRVETRKPDAGGVQMFVSDLLRAGGNGMAADRDADRDSLAGAVLAPSSSDFPLRRQVPPSLPMAQVVRGGLARWQIGRVLHAIREGLDGPIRQKELAAAVQLSPGYFSRAFKQSFGMPPHAYVMRCRIERAKAALLTTATPLCEIALDCGLADQAHLSRLFRRLTGETPCAWRRRHGAGAQTM